MDVTSLYTNIPHEDGIAACKEVWNNRSVKIPPTEMLVELLTLVLKCNNFVFNDKHYLQIQGTAMGTKMAPSYANIFMGRLERQLLSTVTLKPHLWLRFIDDVDMQWTHGRESLQTFLDHANSFHPSIKFTSEVSNERHVFLDTVSKLKDNKIVVDLYSKPSDTHQYLLTTSCHPKHCCQNIPYSQALRIRHICSDTETYQERTEELSEHLLKRGYSSDCVLAATEKALAFSREELLQYKHKTTESSKRTPFVVTFHPNLPNIHATVDRHWPTIESSQRLSRMFPEKPLIAYRRPKSLRDILVRAKVKSATDTTSSGQSGPCGAPRCQTCTTMPSTSTFLSSNGSKSASVNGHAVGETKQTLAKRMNLHRSDWKTRKFNRSPVAEHFNMEGHTFADILLCCIEFNDRWTDKQRKERETYWIRRLNTLQPIGINKGD
ncbi:uncharacterized protein LOC123530291 [Mercenaria mercenaria]|uniref:uncharacterized protein LOC123530291 n=1 Tax=Mercenaria mercenaria TaxID=6596 RepID=UPI00234F75F8|nr:uncharacterized protein LOC123530291 [Mercenaria mercenaria]